MSTTSTKIEQTIANIPAPGYSGIAEQIRARWDSLTKPRGSLGRLEEAIVWVGEVQQDAQPRLERRAMFVFCGDHGITEEGVSAYPSVVTREMVKNFVRGGGAINVLCRQLEIETRVIDAGVAGAKIEGAIDLRVGDGTCNFLRGPAMSRAQAIVALENGIDLAEQARARFDIAGVGEMGIGNSTSAAALLCALTGASPESAVGRGAGLDEEGVRHKCEVVKGALKRAVIPPDDPLSALEQFGGFEIATMSGFLLGAARRALPVVLDGFIGGAAFLAARRLYAYIGRHVLFSHRSAEHGHRALLEAAHATPLLDLDMRLGEGTGAALAIGLLMSASALYREMATFAEASVSDLENKAGQV